MIEHKITTTCPRCGRTNDYQGGVTSSRPPHDGAVAVCIGCHGLAVYVAGPLGLALRLPTAEELAEITADPGVRRVLAALRKIKADMS